MKADTFEKLVSGVPMLDEREKEGWNPGKSLFQEEEYPVTLLCGREETIPEKKEYSLDGTWEMAEGGTEEERIAGGGHWADSMDANVPCSVHTALFEAGKIPDPLKACNDAIARKNSYKTWWFRKGFRMEVGRKPDELFFQGVCYQADFWLNGIYLGEHRGMISEFSFDVGKYLKEDNELVVRIANAPEKQNPMSAYMDNDDGWKKGTVINCVYGWHYACIPSRGIWRSVGLRYKKSSFWAEKPFVMTQNAAEGKIHICVRLHGASGKEKVRGNLSPDNFEGKTWSFSCEPGVCGPDGVLNLAVRVPEPRLWWPLHHGEQNLYRLCLWITAIDGTEHTFETTFGIRTIQMMAAVGQTDANQYKWMFVINEKPIFVKGSNWCTTDALLRFPEERYERFLTLAAKGNIQLLRAWGGGMPENDIFYRYCDKLGILVIQEWPTCWDSQKEQPLTELEETVRYHMPRLRNHPSLVMWCGGNESKEADGEAMDRMAKLAYELDGSRPFHRTEPWGGSLHDYSTYWDMGDIDLSLRLESVFLGEFGMASAPNYESVMKYLSDSEKAVWPPERFGSFGHHTPRFNQLEPNDMAHMENSAVLFCRLDSLEHFIWATQMAQATGVRHTLEAYRCRFPKAAGVCYYKLTDVYPACSWATLDYYGVQKLSYYVLADSYEPLHACLLLDSTRICQGWEAPVYLLDDALKACGHTTRIEITAYDDKLQIIKRKMFDGPAQAEVSACLGTFSLEEDTAEAVCRKSEEGLVLITIRVYLDGEKRDETFYWLNFQKKQGSLLELPAAALAWETQEGILTITNSGEIPAVGVTVECPEEAEHFWVEDSMFWLNPGETRRLALNKTKGLRIRAFNT